MWVEKYRPKSIASMVGNEEARLKLMLWLRKWKKGAKAALLVGPPGTGKTTLVHLLAAQERVNLVELNASDARSKERLTEGIAEVTVSTSLFEERSLIFLDEVDGLAGRKDYGAVEYIKETIKTAKNPIVMAANDPEAEEVRKLESSSVVIQMKPAPPRQVELYLSHIAREEKLETPKTELESIVKNSHGDLRYAINSLQSGVSALKDRDVTSVQAINAFFSAPSSEQALRALRAYPRPPRDKLREIYVSILRARLPPEQRAAALQVLSQADILMGRILSGGDWRLLRYIDNLLVHGLKPVLDGANVQYSLEAVPWNLQLRLWNDSKKLREFTRVYSRRFRVGYHTAALEDVPFLLTMCSDQEFRDALLKGLDLDETFEKFLAKESARSA